jgi:hypothetical protein
MDQVQLGFDAQSAAYRFDLKTAGLPAGDYLLHVEVMGDPVLHAVRFHLK